MGKLRPESLEVEVSLSCTVSELGLRGAGREERKVTDHSSDPGAEEVSRTLEACRSSEELNGFSRVLLTDGENQILNSEFLFRSLFFPDYHL